MSNRIAFKPSFIPRFMQLFRPNGITKKSAVWIVWAIIWRITGPEYAKEVGDELYRRIEEGS